MTLDVQVAPGVDAAIEGDPALLRQAFENVVTNAVHEAAKNGDRSENGDYIYGKRRLREIDSRVRFLNKRLDLTRGTSKPPHQPDDRREQPAGQGERRARPLISAVSAHLIFQKAPDQTRPYLHSEVILLVAAVTPDRE